MLTRLTALRIALEPTSIAEIVCIATLTRITAGYYQYSMEICLHFQGKTYVFVTFTFLPHVFSRLIMQVFSLTNAGLFADNQKEITIMVTKATTNQNPVKNIKQEGKKAAKEVAYSPAVEKLTRLGYAVKGFLYMAIGFTAIAGALGKSTTPADQMGAIASFRKLPYAEPVLWIILIGLVAYSLWGVTRAILDPFHKGSDLKGLLARVGYLISAVTYASFVIPTYELIQGARHPGSSTHTTVQLVSKVMSMPMGRWIVGLIGLAAVAAGLYQIYSAIKMDFDQRFKPYALDDEQKRVATQVGRFGIIARGIVFAIVGGFLVLAAYQANPGSARGFDGAFRFLANQPYGLYLLGIVAAGLIAFGIYSFMSAAWFRLKR